MSATRIVMGLGNPGPRYAGTRHNLGFAVAARVAELLGVALQPGGGAFDLARVPLPGGGRALLVRPLTFMNRCGEALASLAGGVGREAVPAAPADILVVCDDLALPPGRLRLRPAGSDGGHKGLRSVQESLGSQAFPRLRLGIGAPAAGTGVVDHVLGQATGIEAEVLEKAVSVAALAVVTWLDSVPLPRLMSCLNRR